MTPRPLRICSVFDCGRAHYAHGFCRRHYEAQKKNKPSALKASVRWLSAWLASSDALSVPRVRW